MGTHDFCLAAKKEEFLSLLVTVVTVAEFMDWMSLQVHVREAACAGVVPPMASGSAGSWAVFPEGGASHLRKWGKGKGEREEGRGVPGPGTCAFQAGPLLHSAAPP